VPVPVPVPVACACGLCCSPVSAIYIFLLAIDKQRHAITA